MRNYILTCFIFLSFAVYGQRIEGEELIKISETYLKEAVGEELLGYFTHSDNVSHYRMKKNRFGHKPSKRLKKNRKTRKNWTEIWLHWSFWYPKIKGVRGSMWIKLSKDLELLEPIDLKFIPDFILTNTPSNFITINEAVEIGNKNLNKTEFGRSKPELYYDKKSDLFIYIINNKITQEINREGKKEGEMIILKIDAITGNVLEVSNVFYGRRIIIR